MTTTAWQDFATNERGIIYQCSDHAQGCEAEDTDTEPATVTCPFHSITTFPQPQPPKQKQVQSRMATSKLFPADDAVSLLPLRQQIIANATVLFPAVVKGKHNTLFRWGHASPDVLFEIALLATSTSSEAHALAEGPTAATKYQAILTHGLVTKQATAATGDVSESVVGAMESLLAVLCHELGKRREDAVEGIGEAERVRSLGGYVNGGLFRKVGLAGKVGGRKG